MRKSSIFLFGLIAAGAAGAWFIYSGASWPDTWQNVLSTYRKGYATMKDLFHRILDKLSINTGDAYSRALDMIAEFETFSAHAYPDAAGYSIGYGHFIRQGDPYDSTSIISEEEAYVLLEQDARGAQACVDGAVSTQITDNSRAALYSFTYNVGCGAFQGSTLLKKVNAGDLTGAALEFSRWNKSQGQVLQALVDRRAIEMEVFQA